MIPTVDAQTVVINGIYGAALGLRSRVRETGMAPRYPCPNSSFDQRLS